MPRIFDGPIPERPDRNALPDRVNELLERFLDGPRSGEGRGHWLDLHDMFEDLPFRDRGETGDAKVSSDGAARVGPAAPSVAAPAVEERTSADVAARHFEAEGDFNRHVDHYNSQALSAHPDWFML
jgi:hypothetical protein